MPRGRKKETLENLTEELTKVDDRIAYYKQQLSNLKVHRKKLCAAIEKTEMESLYAAVKASGKTPKEWLTQFHPEGQ